MGNYRNEIPIKSLILTVVFLVIGLLLYPQITAQVERVTECREWEDEIEEVEAEVHNVEDLPQVITAENEDHVEDSEEIRVYDTEENEYILEKDEHYNVISYESGEYEIFELP